MKKTVKIFLASSLVEFKEERLELENFIRNVSDRYEEKYQIKLQPLLCENFDPVMANGRKQEEYNEMIRGCDFCFFVFFTRAGEYTVEEFKVAYQQFSQNGKPKIYTYFKELGDASAEQSLLDFMELLDKKLGHYYNPFAHLDTLKLRILLCVHLLEMDFVCIETKDNTCFVDGQAVLGLENVAEFHNNTDLQNVQQELLQAEQQCAALKDGDDLTAYEDALLNRRHLRQKADNLRKRIFECSLGILRDTVYGTVSERQLTAFRCLEKGDLQGALDTLRLADMQNDFLQEQKAIEDTRRASVTKFLQEIKMRIRLLAIQYDHRKGFHDMEEAFLTAIPLVIQEETELDILFAYMDFLQCYKEDYPAAIAAGEQLRTLYQKVNADNHLRVALYDALTSLYQTISDNKTALQYHLLATQTLEQLYSKDILRYGATLAESYRSLAFDYQKSKNAKKYALYFCKAIDVLKTLYAVKPSVGVADDLINNYNDLGLYYNGKRRYKKGEKFFMTAIDLHDTLLTEPCHPAHETILCVYANLLALYNNHPRLDTRHRFKQIHILSKHIALLEGLQNGSLVALSRSWGFDNDTFRDSTNIATDAPLKLYADMLPEEQKPIPFGAQWAFALSQSYTDYGYYTKNVQKYFKKAYDLVMQYPDDPLCQRKAESLKEWVSYFN